MKAVMMAGGFGTRIQPLTNSIPKPMLPIVNIPMMEHILIKLKKSGIDEIVILLFFKPEVIKNHFKDGSKWGVKIEYILPDADYGTAGAVKFAQKYLDETFMIVSGDLVTDFDFKKIFKFHQKKDAKVTITLTSVENPLQFGVVITDKDQKIKKFLEKPTWGEVFSDTINTGIYIIEPEILDYIPENENFDFAKDLFPLLMEKKIDLYGYHAVGYWRDVGNPDSYREVHDDIFKEKVKFKIPNKKIEKRLDGEIYFTGDSKIDKSVEIIDKVVIGNNVKIGKNVRLHNVVIGDNTTIKDNTKIKNSIIWCDAKIGKDVILDNSVICNDTVIEDGVKARSGLILAERSKIGKFAQIEQDVTIWPDKEIEPASIVTNDLIWGTKYKNTLFEEGSIIGKINIEIGCEEACKIGEAFGSLFPIGSKVVVGRGENPNARMLKRAFVGGVLSTGVDVIDLKDISPAILRFMIANEKKAFGGAYFGKDLNDDTSIFIDLFDEFGLRIDTNSKKKIEQGFFKGKIRKAEFDKTGKIYDEDYIKDEIVRDYKDKLEDKIDHNIIKKADFKIAIDLMFGITKEIFPQIITDLKIENIILNSYSNPVKLSNIENLLKSSLDNLSKIVKSLNYNLGIAIFPHGQRLVLVDDEGHVYDRVKALISVLKLMDMEGKKFRVFLPSWAPDMEFENIDIEKGKYYDFSIKKLKKYDLIATVDGNFAFTDFSFNRDAIFASLKIMEMLSHHNLKLSQITKDIKEFYYIKKSIPCPQSKKGFIMRKFLEAAEGKKYSTTEGVKIYEDDGWILMLPSQYFEKVDLYIQAKDKKSGEKIYKKYEKLIHEWLS